MIHRSPTSQPAPRPLGGADGLALALALLVALGLFVALRDHGFDDPYITYRYAQNLAGGRGFVYNPGERVLSTTAPLYALLLAPLAALGLDLPPASNAVACLGFGLSGLALYGLGRAWRAPVAGGFAGITCALFPGLLSTIGSEIGVFLALVLWGFVAVARGRHRAAALLLALATLVRADGAAAMAAAGLFVLATRPAPAAGRGAGALRPLSARGRGGALRDLPWGAALLYLGLLAPWLLFAWAYFGSALPVTLAVKQQQALVPGSQLYLSGLLGYLGYLWAAPLYRALLILAVIGLLAALWRRRPWLLPIGWGLLMALAYTLLGVTAYFWYFAQPFVALVIAAGLGAQALVDLARRWGRWPARLTLAALVGLALLAEGQSLRQQVAHPDPRLAVYREVGAWLAAHAAPADRVGALEVGVVGFYSRRPMVDFAGLIQPAVAAQLGAGDGYPGAISWAITRYRPAWLVLGEPLRPLVETHREWSTRCAVAAGIADPAGGRPQTIYRCQWYE